MSDNPDESSKDALGLDIDSLKISGPADKAEPAQTPQHDTPTSDTPAVNSPELQPGTDQQEQKPTTEATPDEAPSPTTEAKSALPRERKKPYINPERVRTGGAQREKLTEDELAQRMLRIREQNEKIKQRRLDVEEDEREFKKTQEQERMKLVRNKKVQENVDRAREQNARRKLDKIQNREWDSGKPGVKRSAAPEPSNPANQPPAQAASIGIRGGVRGGGAGRGRGRGARPAPAAAPPPPVANEKLAEPAPTAAS